MLIIMNGYIVHNSVDEEYRSPLGAISTGGKVKLSLYVQYCENCRVKLLVHSESGGFEVELQKNDCFFSAEIVAPDNPQVLWYRFFIEHDDEKIFYGPKQGESCGVGQVYLSDSPFFQLTVCDSSFKTPDSFKGKIMYQIFPDRFCSSGQNILEGVKYHESRGWRVSMHKSFDENVNYLPLDGDEYYSPIDFFGGDLKGIASKLDYISDLGVGIIYLNPIFSSESNHRYDTADYKKIDRFLGCDEDFSLLCNKADEKGIKIILDGVFSHTGDESIYFQDAIKGNQSPYFSWYSFNNFPSEYKCWWGFKTLPEVNEHDPSWQNFIIKDDDSVIKHWLRAGAGGYRLDVADELPDDIIELMRAAVKEIDDENLLLGEVWEDATTKQSYGSNRKYALGRALDSVMNYPLRSAIISFLKKNSTAKQMTYFLLSQQQNYSPQMYYCLMNLLSSHDVERMRTVLSASYEVSSLSREEQANISITEDEDIKGAALLKLAVSIIMSIPGIPSIYYGDECGMHGLKDPFNRSPFKITDSDMIEFYKKWGKLRQKRLFKTGFASFIHVFEDVLAIFRFTANGTDAFLGECEKDEAAIVVINRSDEDRRLCVDLHSFKFGISLNMREYLSEVEFISGIGQFGGVKYQITDGLLDIEISKMSSECILLNKKER